MLGEFPMRPPVPVWDASGEEASDTVEVIDELYFDRAGKCTRIRKLGGEVIQIDRDFPVVRIDPTVAFVVQETLMTKEEFRLRYPEAA